MNAQIPKLGILEIPDSKIGNVGIPRFPYWECRKSQLPKLEMMELLIWAFPIWGFPDSQNWNVEFPRFPSWGSGNLDIPKFENVNLENPKFPIWEFLRSQIPNFKMCLSNFPNWEFEASQIRKTGLCEYPESTSWGFGNFRFPNWEFMNFRFPNLAIQKLLKMLRVWLIQNVPQLYGSGCPPPHTEPDLCCEFAND